MNGFLSKVIILIFALAVANKLVPTMAFRTSTDMILAAIVLALLNASIKPVMILFTLPINILTLGLFTLVINGIILALTAALVPGFFIAGFGSAILGGLVISIMSILISLLF